MGVSFRMDGWLGNSGIQPDGALAVGLGSGPSPRRCRVSGATQFREQSEAERK